jgi:hypothetical protein
MAALLLCAFLGCAVAMRSPYCAARSLWGRYPVQSVTTLLCAWRLYRVQSLAVLPCAVFGAIAAHSLWRYCGAQSLVLLLCAVFGDAAMRSPWQQYTALRRACSAYCHYGTRRYVLLPSLAAKSTINLYRAWHCCRAPRAVLGCAVATRSLALLPRAVVGAIAACSRWRYCHVQSLALLPRALVGAIAMCSPWRYCRALSLALLLRAVLGGSVAVCIPWRRRRVRSMAHAVETILQ